MHSEFYRDEENDAVCTVVVPLKKKRNHSPKFRLYVGVILETTSTHASACFPAAEVASTVDNVSVLWPDS